MTSKPPDTMFRSALLQHLPFTRWYGNRPVIIARVIFLLLIAALALAVVLLIGSLRAGNLGQAWGEFHDNVYLPLKGHLHIRYYPLTWAVWLALLLVAGGLLVSWIFVVPVTLWLWLELLRHFARHDQYHHLFRRSPLHRKVVDHELTEALIALGQNELAQAAHATCTRVVTCYLLAERLAGPPVDTPGDPAGYRRAFERLARWYHIYLALRVNGPDRRALTEAADRAWLEQMHAHYAELNAYIDAELSLAGIAPGGSSPRGTPSGDNPAAPRFAAETLRGQLATLVMLDQQHYTLTLQPFAGIPARSHSLVRRFARLVHRLPGRILSGLRWIAAVLVCILFDGRYVRTLLRALWSKPREAGLKMVIAQRLAASVATLIVITTPLWLAYAALWAMTRLAPHLISREVWLTRLPYVAVGAAIILVLWMPWMLRLLLRAARRLLIGMHLIKRPQSAAASAAGSVESGQAPATAPTVTETRLMGAVIQRSALLNRAYVHLEQVVMTGDANALDKLTLEGMLDTTSPHPATIPASTLGMLALEIALHVATVCHIPDLALRTLELNDSLLFMLHSFDAHTFPGAERASTTMALLKELTSQMQPNDLDNDSVLSVSYHYTRHMIIALARQDLHRQTLAWHDTDLDEASRLRDQAFDARWLKTMVFDLESDTSHS